MTKNRLINRSTSGPESVGQSETYGGKASPQVGDKRITQGQLDAVVFRLREELDKSLRRAGTAASASITENVLTVRVEHSLTAAEHHLMRRASGRTFFQHYIEELAEQVYPTFAHHVEHILSCTVTYTNVKVECENDRIVFAFGLRP